MCKDLTNLLTSDPLAELRNLAQTVPVPSNLYVGPANLFDALPREVLAFYRLRKLSADPLWAHHRFVMVICLDGPGHVIIDGTMHRLTPAQAVLIFPYQMHHFTRFARTPIRWLFVTFEFDNEAVLGPLRQRSWRLDREALALVTQVVRSVEAFHADRAAPVAAGPLSAAAQAGLWVGLLLARVCAQLPPQRHRDALVADTDLARAQQVVRYVNQHLPQAVTVAELAAHVHVSVAHLRRVFERTMGISLGRYLRRARINRATSLLHRTDLTISQIARATGFRSLYSFSRTFKEMLGVSPRGFRRRLLHREEQ